MSFAGVARPAKALQQLCLVESHDYYDLAECCHIDALGIAALTSEAALITEERGCAGSADLRQHQCSDEILPGGVNERARDLGRTPLPGSTEAVSRLRGELRRRIARHASGLKLRSNEKWLRVYPQ